MGALIRMGALIGIGALINKNTFEGGAYSEGGAYWKEGAKSNHYGISQIQRCKRDIILISNVQQPTSHYLLLGFMVVLGPDGDNLSDRVLSR